MDSAGPRPVVEVAIAAGLDPATIETRGPHVAKLPLPAPRPGPAPMVMVTSLTPTPLGEGKTTTAVGLAQGLQRLGRRPVVALRQPSLGPTFGIKGGAAGAGRSQVVPAEELNLHLTGDFHAVTAAHNLLAAMVDSHLHHGNAFGIVERTISWPRVLDVNDRALRHVVVGLGSAADGVTRQASFDITAASEVMTILALARDWADLRARLGRIVVARRADGSLVTAEDLQAAGAMAALLRDALRPNLLQTTEGCPVLIHTGPFGNIATGNSSVVADLLGSQLGDVLITESGFGTDLGAERMVNVVSRAAGLAPALALLVVTIRALKAHSGRYRIRAGSPLPAAMSAENVEEVEAGCVNLGHHLRTLRQWGITPLVAINAFPSDHPAEWEVVRRFAGAYGVRCEVSTHVADGGAGAEDLARAVVELLPGAPVLRRDYDLEEPLADKLAAVARRVYGATGIELQPAAAQELARFSAQGYARLPVVIAKTHLSITHQPGLDPAGEWCLPIREVRLAAGAGYVYALTGEISTMPGLPSVPNATRVDLLPDGTIVGLT